MLASAPTEIPEGGFLFIVITQAYKFSPFAPMAPAYHAALSPGGRPALFRHVSRFCFRGLCGLLLHVRGNFAAGHLVAE